MTSRRSPLVSSFRSQSLIAWTHRAEGPTGSGPGRKAGGIGAPPRVSGVPEVRYARTGDVSVLRTSSKNPTTATRRAASDPALTDGPAVMANSALTANPALTDGATSGRPFGPGSFRCGVQLAWQNAGRLVLSLIALFSLLAVTSTGFAQEDFAAQLPRIAPLEPAEALKSFKLLPGFRLELVAAEPDVVDPVAICFDERGRMFVVEMRGYSEDRDKKVSRIRLLEDTDNDGRFEKSTVFADGLLWPTALFWTNGGLLVADAPDLLYFEDADGDGRAESRKTVFTGFGTSNVQGLLNTFLWGLDNRIVGSSSSSGGTVQAVMPGAEQAAPAVNLRGRDFAINFAKRTIEPLTGGGQHGMTFSDWGDRFVCSNSDHLQQIVFEERYLARNPYAAISGARVSIAADGPQADVFRTSPVEPWRELRTRLRVTGKAPGIVERGGLASGYFTSATGVTVYRGDAWPKEFRGLVFVSDVGSNLIHRKRLVDTGILFRGERIDEQSEFLTSTDNWFRPVQMANAPDGCLYVCDMYREVVEHPASLPPDIKKHLDLSSRGRGRIWRIVPEGFRRPEPPRLHEASEEQLVELLNHPNAWHRETASRLLCGVRLLDSREKLKKMAFEADSPEARIHAMWMLREIEQPVDLKVFQDPHPRVRQNGVIVAERYLSSHDEYRQAVFSLADDDSPRVRFQVALSIGEAPSGPQRNQAILRLIENDPASDLMRNAILSSLRHGAGDVYARIANHKRLSGTSAGRVWLQTLARQVDRLPRDDAQNAADVQAFLTAVAALARQAETDPQAAELIRLTVEAVGPRMATDISTATKGKSDELFAQSVALALSVAPDRDAPADQRITAIQRLRRGRFEEVREPLAGLLVPTEATAIQAAAFDTLRTFNHPSVAAIVIERFPALSPALKAKAVDLLCGSAERAAALLDAVEARKIAAADIDAGQWKLLTTHRDAKIAERAATLFEAVRPADRKEVVEAYRDVLSLAGDKERGKAVFAKQCANCHKVEGVGHELGPNLAAMKQRGAEAILVNVLDPNREVNPQFVSYAVLTSDGRALSGLIAGETATSITLRRAENATDTVLRVDIEELRSTGQSLMPEGLEKQLDKQAMADLIAYLMSAN